MPPSHVVLSGVLRQVALASQRAASSAHHGIGAATLFGPCSATNAIAPNSKIIASWPFFWLHHQLATSGSQCLACARGLCTKSGEPPLGVDSPSNTIKPKPKSAELNGNLDASGPATVPSEAISFPAPASAAVAAAAPRQQHPRGKPARLHVRTPSGPPPPLARSLKDKAAKVLSAKAAAAMAAVKAGGGQQPLPREARLQLDTQLAEMPLPPAPYRGRHAAADGPRSVHVTGFYTGHPFTRASAEAVAAKLRNQPLAGGVTVAGVYHDHEDALIIMTHGSPHGSLSSSSQSAQSALSASSASSSAPISVPAVAAVAAASSPPIAAAATTSTPAPAAFGSATATAGATAGAPSSTGLTASGVATDISEPSPLVAAEAIPASAAPLEAAEEFGPMGAGTDGAGAMASPLLAVEAAEAATATAGGGASEAPVFGSLAGRGSRQVGSREGEALFRFPFSEFRCWLPFTDSPCMAVMLLEYGGVAFFNVPESLQTEALMWVAAAAAAALPDGKSADPRMTRPLPRQPQLRGTNRTAEAEAWRQVVERLSMHKEEQLIVVDPNMIAGRGTGRWIRKLDDSLHIWAWDSTTLESIARVLSQSAAIRYYNQECEDMLERYETIMPLGYEAPEQRLSGINRLLFWRSRLPLRDLRQMVFKSSGIRVRLDSRLGLRDPPSGTWESARHHAVWDAIRREFELEDRRDTLMDKTDLLKQSCLDLISANNESFTKRSELSIILLITVEIIISLTDLHSALSAENVGRAFGWMIDSLGVGLGPADAPDGGIAAATTAAVVVQTAPETTVS
ncbi:hypothetical protein Vafri_8478 [Volvox africanus]|uniref:DUF155 domain-containing protein n=1 Tax=Volvox africanus TaxID=51714 RepID=A0A8J4B2J0_9CHLO|nr:hypothetical protein Vafri_8478 [Volvox africanus]